MRDARVIGEVMGLGEAKDVLLGAGEVMLEGGLIGELRACPGVDIELLPEAVVVAGTEIT